MARHQRFTFLCSDNEREIITSLADRLQRTESDAVRWLVVNAARKLGEHLSNHDQSLLDSQSHVDENQVSSAT